MATREQPSERAEPDNFLGYTLFPNAFRGGLLLPTLVFGVLDMWPALDRRLFGGARSHNLLDRPRDDLRRTAALVAFLSFVSTARLTR